MPIQRLTTQPGKSKNRDRDEFNSIATPIDCLGTCSMGNRNQVLAQQQFDDQYGPVVDLRMGRTHTVVIGAVQAAWDKRKSSVTSSRPQFIMARDSNQ
ncbi:hypothetical protein K438DRAFT_1834483 [Mycena galopus ATCC 62051]|nr:hypothetical protein K438DRAFT_1834483 [Mycena galopus ATCC 62051]